MVTNHPAFGGSHLPDVTVITPVYDGDPEDPRLPLGFVASRAHHAEIGGSRPGSMPPDARRLVEEGVVIPPTRVVGGGRPDWDRLRDLLLSAPWPTRNVEDAVATRRRTRRQRHRLHRSLRSGAGSRPGSEIDTDRRAG